MDDETAVKGASGYFARLRRTRFATRLSVIVERAWPLILPLAVIVSLFVSLAWLGVFRALPDAWRLGAAVVFLFCAVAALYPLRFFRLPRNDEVDRRIERANLLEHTPVRVQTDRPAGDAAPFGQALWREHQSRMAARLAGVGADLPRTAVPERDPWALRAVAALLLV